MANQGVPQALGQCLDTQQRIVVVLDRSITEKRFGHSQQCRHDSGPGCDFPCSQQCRHDTGLDCALPCSQQCRHDGAVMTVALGVLSRAHSSAVMTMALVVLSRAHSSAVTEARKLSNRALDYSMLTGSRLALVASSVLSSKLALIAEYFNLN